MNNEMRRLAISIAEKELKCFHKNKHDEQW